MKNRHPVPRWLIVLAIVFVVAMAYVVHVALSDDPPQQRRRIATVELLKSPPPPELPPELEPIEEELEEEVPLEEETPEENEPLAETDDVPAGESLGLDADGTGAGDSFGLVGKKGGKSLIGGGNGLDRLAMLTRHAGYIQRVEAELYEQVMKRLDEEGWFPRGKLKVIIKLRVDPEGRITDYSIIGSSGSHKMDEAVRSTLQHCTLSTPPNNKFTTMSLKISARS